jgi:glycosyltransferase involved in cell wall biosynthesis
MPRVSVLLTCYNHLAYLPEALAGVRAQTFTDIEVIAIDDGSIDGTREWLEAHAPDCKLVFNERNLGTYGTLNRALGASTGEFVAILNDDDVWAPEKLQKQVELLDSNQRIGLVHTDGFFIDGSGRRLEGSPLGFEFPRTETGNILLALLYQNKIIASAALARRSCFDELGGFNEEYFGSGDWEMWLRIAERYLVGYVAEPLTMYRVHGANASHKLDRIWQDDQRLREWIRGRYDLYDGLGLQPAAVKAAKAHNDACLGTIYTLNGRPDLGRKAYADSIRRSPGRLKSYLRWLTTFLPRNAFQKLIRL